MITINRRRYMGAKSEEDLLTLLRRMDCIAYFPLSYDGDTTDIINNYTLTNIDSSRFYWDSTKEMYYVNCLAHKPAALFSPGSNVWTNGYGVMCKCEAIDGFCDIITILWNNVNSHSYSPIVSEELSWAGTFLQKVGKNMAQTRYVNDTINNEGNNVSWTSTATDLGIGRNRRYSASGNAYIKYIAFFTRKLSFNEYCQVKAKIEESNII